MQYDTSVVTCEHGNSQHLQLTTLTVLRASWTDSSRSLMTQRGSSATGGSMTPSHRSSAMFSTGCQSHSASSTSSVYSSSYDFTELLQSTCAIAASGLIPLRLGYICDHLRRPIFGCGG